MTVRLAFFGCFSVWRCEQPVHIHLRGTTLELFCYLLLHAGRDVRREKLAFLLWPDRPDATARNLLSTALWRIKKEIDSIGSMQLQADRRVVRIDLGEDVSSDARALHESLRDAHDHAGEDLPNRAALLRALGEQDEEFLEGLQCDWAQIERERHFNLRVGGLLLLLNHATKTGFHQEALGYGKRVLALDPFRECVQRQVMWLLVQAGRPAQALLEYARFEKLLHDEMGIKPMKETDALRLLIHADSAATDSRAAELAASQLRQAFDLASSGRQAISAALAAATL